MQILKFTKIKNTVLSDLATKAGGYLPAWHPLIKHFSIPGVKIIQNPTSNDVGTEWKM